MKGLIGSLAREALCNTEFWRMEAIGDWHLRSARYVGRAVGMASVRNLRIEIPIIDFTNLRDGHLVPKSWAKVNSRLDFKIRKVRLLT